MSRRYALGLALTTMAVAVVTAHAQTLPWPTDPPPQAQRTAPWPGGGAPAQATAAPPPGVAMGSPGMGAPGMGAPGVGGPPMGVPQIDPATQQACLGQFNAHRAEVEKNAMAARAGGEKHASREEMCKLVSAYANAESKWVKFTQDNVTKCGIPQDAIKQLKGVHAHTLDIRKKICAAGPVAGAPAAPSLSDALGTTRLPSQETEKRKPGGTMDTLTGNATR